MNGFYIDVSELRAIQSALNASESQFIGAFNKALRATTTRLSKESATLLMQVTGAKGQEMRKRRVRYFVSKMTSQKSGGGKIWFGLNDVPVSSLKGTMRGQRKIKRKRDDHGRFVKKRGARGATFVPKSSALVPVSFVNSFIATLFGKKTIWIRTSSGFLNEARISIREPMIGGIDNGIYPQAGEMLLDYFAKDLRGRVAGGVK